MQSFFPKFMGVVSITCCLGVRVAASAVCVNNAHDLQVVLTNAEGSTSATTIKVARGTYNLGGVELIFTTQAVGQGQLDISGGYNYDGGLCSSQIKNPALTVLDGQGMNAVLSLQSSQGISVRYLTIQGGSPVHNEAGGLFVASSGGIIVDYNIIRNNSAVMHAAGIDAQINGTTATADIHIAGNLISGNTSQEYFGAGVVRNAGTGGTYVTNNTVVGNTSPNSLGGLAVYGSSIAGSAYVSNNVLWGNSGGDLIEVSGPIFINNDYQTLVGAGGAGSTGNVHVDPQFVSGGNFHLSTSSPLLGQGLCSPAPAGGLPSIDIEGHSRTYDAATCAVDMGAYERGDQIFEDGYDN